MRVILQLTIFIWAMNVNAQAAKYSQEELERHLQKVTLSKSRDSVIWSLDTIYRRGIPYAILKNNKSEFTLYSISGKELLFIQLKQSENRKASVNERLYYSFLFLQSASRAGVSSYNVGYVEEFIVRNELVANHSIDAEKERLFILKYSIKNFEKKNVLTGTLNSLGETLQEEVDGAFEKYKTVERNHGRPIRFVGSNIEQDAKEIGRMEASTELVNGVLITTYTFFLPYGKRVARVDNEGLSAPLWRVKTYEDKRTQYIRINSGNEALDLVQFLSDHFYM